MSGRGPATVTAVRDGNGRMLPALTPTSAFFWSAADGRLRIQRCRSCGRFSHPPAPLCRHCHSTDVGPEEVSGRGFVYTYTVNRQPWSERLSEPYVIAIIELVEEPGLRILTNVVECAPATVSIGMPVEVVFEPIDDVVIPQFRPASPEDGPPTERARGT